MASIAMSQMSILLLDVVLIFCLLFLTPQRICDHLWPAQVYFQPTLTSEEHGSLLQLLTVFQEAVERANITYFMYEGSAVGAARHHGIIPWDDDIDVCVVESYKDRLEKVLSKLEPMYKLTKHSLYLIEPPNVWKFHRVKGIKSFAHHRFNWPYIDIMFCRQNATHVYLPEQKIDIPIEDVYPLRRLPFRNTLSTTTTTTSSGTFPSTLKEQLWVPVMCKQVSDAILVNCASSIYSHKLELPVVNWRHRMVRCHQLSSSYQFVHTQRHNSEQNAFVDEVKLGTQTLYRIKQVRLPCDGKPVIQSPFRITYVYKTNNSQTSPLQDFYQVEGFRLF